jgi:hypothetical protein
MRELKHAKQSKRVVSCHPFRELVLLSIGLSESYRVCLSQELNLPALWPTFTLLYYGQSCICCRFAIIPTRHRIVFHLKS